MDRKRLVTALITLAALCAALPAFAAGAEYFAGPDMKLARGVTNVTTGWVEIPKQTSFGSRQTGPPGAIGGFFKGVALGAARTVVGGYEVATFWAPIPERFEPVMKPATVFEGR